MPPVNAAAAKMADAEFYAKYPARRHKPLANSPQDEALRQEWLGLYKKHGGRVTDDDSPILDPISLTAIESGGYRIRFRGTRPGAKVFLCVEKADNRIDVSQGYLATHLKSLLKAIGQVDGWGKTMRCWLVQEVAGKHMGESTARDLAAPVKPYEGSLTFNGIAGATPKLTYPGNGVGRWFTEPIDGKYYFRYASKFETSPQMRGFDCTTFPMSLFQCFPNMAGKYGGYLADQLGATKCDMEQKKEKEIKEFFSDKLRGGTGLYFMFSAGHVVLVKNGTTHEFTYGGYQTGPAATFARYNKAPQGLWWIRKLPDKYKP